MSYSVAILRSAVKSLEHAPKEAQARMVIAIEGLAASPRPSGATKLSGRDAYRIRIGDYRVIYEIDDAAQSIHVIVVAHRKDAYRP